MNEIENLIKSIDNLLEKMEKGGPGSGKKALSSLTPEAQAKERVRRAVRQSKIGAGEIKRPQPPHIRDYWEMRRAGKL